MADRTPINVVFVPIWNQPYQVELSKALAREGAQVQWLVCLEQFYRDFRTGPASLDVLHIHSLPYFSLRPRAALRYALFFKRVLGFRREGVRLVWTLHDFHNHDSYYSWIEDRVGRWLATRVSALIVHGEAARQIVLSSWGNEVAARLHVIPHGNYLSSYSNRVTREQARRALGLEAGHRVFLFFGIIRPYKGLLNLVETFKRLGGHQSRLLIAGLPISEQIKQQVRVSCEGDPRILHRMGHVADYDVQFYLNACDIMVLPYARVFTSGAAILGMSFARACIAPRVGGIPDILDDRGAFFFDPEVPDDLERAMNQVMCGESDLVAMGNYNFQRSKTWDWGEIGRKTAQLYRSCG